MSKSTNKKVSRREQRRARKRKQKLKSQIGWGAAALLTVAFVGYLLWTGIRPPLGEIVSAEAAGQHIGLNTPPPPYDTDPPTSGSHYANPLPAGFYDETSPEVTDLPNPEGFIVHALEHGYVVFWYNCTLVSEQECSNIKSQLRAALDEAGNLKVIAFPWATADAPVVATSWGRMLKMETFDPDLVAKFIQRNRNQAPESNAP